MRALEDWQAERNRRCATLRPEVASAILSLCHERRRLTQRAREAFAVGDVGLAHELLHTRDECARMTGDQMAGNRVMP